MNGLITVGKGSKHPPALVEISYCTDSELPLLALVGKGITFDMGGMNVKIGKADGGGTATVIKCHRQPDGFAGIPASG